MPIHFTPAVVCIRNRTNHRTIRYNLGANNNIEVCKTFIRRLDSDPRLQYLPDVNNPWPRLRAELRSYAVIATQYASDRIEELTTCRLTFDLYRRTLRCFG